MDRLPAERSPAAGLALSVLLNFVPVADFRVWFDFRTGCARRGDHGCCGIGFVLSGSAEGARDRSGSLMGKIDLKMDNLCE